MLATKTQEIGLKPKLIDIRFVSAFMQDLLRHIFNLLVEKSLLQEDRNTCSEKASTLFDDCLAELTKGSHLKMSPTYVVWTSLYCFVLSGTACLILIPLSSIQE